VWHSSCLAAGSPGSVVAFPAAGGRLARREGFL